MRQAFGASAGCAVLQASGSLGRFRLRKIAESGIGRIAIDAVTKDGNAPARA